MLLAAQALDLGLPVGELVIATMNPGHLGQFVATEHWFRIDPALR